MLDAAAAAESRSEHPLGQAIVSYARAQGRDIAEPERFDYTPGRGIAATVGGAEILVGNRQLMSGHGIIMPAALARQSEAASEILVARNGELLGQITVADTVRPEARGAVEALGRMRLRTILLTGDTEAVARSVAGTLGIKEYEAGLLPEDKLARIKELVSGGRVVAMLGDAWLRSCAR